MRQAPDRNTIPTPGRLKRRADFLAAARGTRAHGPAFTVQSGKRAGFAENGPRFGFTVTKKVGHAVARNRIRRRLREALRLAAALPAMPDHDYVIVARQEALTRDFSALQADLGRLIAKADAALRDPRGRQKPAKPSSSNPSRPKR